MRILLTGGSGMLGANLCLLNPGHELYPTYATHATRHPNALPLDITDPAAVEAAVAHLQPEVIIHTAGMTKPLACEQDPEMTHRVNVGGTKYLVEAAERVGARFVFLSTDVVFGDSEAARDEDSAPNPMSVYGRSKAAAEAIVACVSRDYAIVRISVLYGWSSQYSTSFAEWVLSQLRAGQRASLFADQWRQMTYIPDLVAALYELATRPAPLNGILHVVGPDVVTRHSFGLELARVFGLPDALVAHASVHDLPALAAISPDRAILDTGKMQRLLHARISPVAEGLRDMRAREAAGYPTRFAAWF